jgi:hypothetical protein
LGIIRKYTVARFSLEQFFSLGSRLKRGKYIGFGTMISLPGR